ncbi:hypothetical protein SAMN02910314_01634 [Denitrobacterium detoxificans]|uniref:Viscotoxin-A3 n=2 Tax=Denitrobacterium detoxificans TaxID=79604 RepID=A0A1H8TNC5_9ACTN|nr:hypothetical protein SAMN02910314_01634 [Denitrobacterium detoxificans]
MLSSRLRREDMGFAMSEYEGLTDEQVERERALLKGVPVLNLGALFLPPIWGPAHGMWWTIVFYPIWALADSLFYYAYASVSGVGESSPLAVVAAVVVLLLLTAFTFAFARLAQPAALHRALEHKGMRKSEYLRRERIWAVASVVAGCILLALATYYNVVVKVSL